MTLPGLALFCNGLVRAKDLLSVLMHCFCSGLPRFRPLGRLPLKPRL